MRLILNFTRRRATAKLLRYKDTGMTRLEIAMYARDLFNLEDHVALMNDLVDKMSL